MKFASAGKRAPRWLSLVSGVVALLVAGQLLATTRNLGRSTLATDGKGAPTQHLQTTLEGHTLQLGVRPTARAEATADSGAASSVRGSSQPAGRDSKDASAGASGVASDSQYAAGAAAGGGGGGVAAEQGPPGAGGVPAASSAADASPAAAEPAATRDASGASDGVHTGAGAAAHAAPTAASPAGSDSTQGAEREQQQQQPQQGLPQLDPGTLRCEASGYCSLGKTRTWRGDITTNAALRDMLQAVSYKNEIILIYFNEPRGIWAEMTLNLVRSAQDLGLGNFFLLASEEKVCKGLPSAFNNISCVWDSRPGAVGTNVKPLDVFWARRWETAARIVRMGYNLLIIDSDAMLHHDPYVFLKSGPLSKYNLLFQRDGPDAYGGGAINCGVMYWQNTHPSGPSVWAAVEHADRTHRHREAFEKMQEVYPEWNTGLTWDQGVWQDMIYSLDAQQPKHTFVHRIATDEWKAVMDPGRTYRHMSCKETAFPPEWLNVTGALDIPVCAFENLAVPRPPNDTWWQQHGHLYYPHERGHQSRAFMELIYDASNQPYAEPGRPWAPEPPPPLENIAFLPSFFVVGFAYRGVHFFGASRPPPQVVSHLVFIQADSKDWKSYLFKGHGWWHWDVTEVYNNGSLLGVPDPKLLMMAPGADLLTDTEQAFRDEVEKLAVLAAALGRRLVVPPVPCDSRWVGIWPQLPDPSPNLTRWQASYDAEQVLQFPDRQRPGYSYCHWNRDLAPACAAKLLPHADAVGFLERSLAPGQATPSASNTLWFQEWGAAGSIDAKPGASASVRTSMAAAVQAAAPFAGVPVLFLGAAPQMDGPVEKLDPEYSACAHLSPSYPFNHSPEMRQQREAQLAAAAGGAAAGPAR